MYSFSFKLGIEFENRKVLEQVDRLRTALRGAPICRVEFRAPDNPVTLGLARKLQRIFISCGFSGEVTLEMEPHREGLELESSNATVAAALAIQSAFHSAGFETTLLIHDKGLRDTVILHLGTDTNF